MPPHLHPTPADSGGPPFDTHDRVRAIAQMVAAAPQPERRAILERECGDDRVLRSRVEMMLLKQDQLQTLDEPTARASTTGLGAARAAFDAALPERIGGYAIRRVLGEGGMGVVYLAEQERPRRTVALKVIRPGLITPRLLRRFEHESETLAKLQHPGIAQIYEAATHESPLGPQPFFAMELVEGKPLTIYALEERLDLRRRLELFARICEAVHHAHQKGVIHRDLKPGNILVTSSGQPKVLDFGIARAANDSNEGNLGGATLRTEAGTLVGTLSYMSPEQVSDPSGVDVRSDVFTLGVILYELVAGRLPHALETHTLPEAVRIVAERDAPSLLSVDRKIPFDVATIVSKAMERDRARRYQSASDMAADIGRYLRDEPILARPASRAYKVRKFVARNRALVTGATLAVLALVGGIIGTAWQAAEATRGRTLAEERGVALDTQRAIAEREARTAKATNDFLNDMLAAASPESASSGDATVRELLDAAAEKLKNGGVEPGVELPLRVTLSNTYRALGRPEDSLREARRAHDLALEQYGKDAIDEMESRRTLAISLAENGKPAEAEALVREVIGVYERDPKKFALEHAEARAELGRYTMELGKTDESIALLAAALPDLRRTRGEKHRNVQTAAHNYAVALQLGGRWADAEKAIRESLVICEKQFGPEHLATAYEMNTLGNILQRLGRNEEALDVHTRTLEMRRKRLEPDHPSVLTSMANRAACLVALQRYDEAIASLRETLEIQRTKLGPSHTKTLSAMNNLAFALEDTGKLDEAEKLMREIVAIQRDKGFTDPEGWGQLNNLGAMLVKRGKAAEAEGFYRDLFKAAEGKLPETHVVRAIYRNNFGECLVALGKLEEAGKELSESHAVILAAFKEGHPRTAKSTARLQAFEAARAARK
ncbi:MAG TPA: serine/threonine-protein kinase [Phycisphaerales bacterium]